MINIINDNIFNGKEKLIAHQVNCQGVMGSGIALQLRNRYTGLFNEYKRFCNLFEYSGDLLGSCFIHQDKDKSIANLFGQQYYGNNPKIIYTIYPALTSSLDALKKYCIDNEIYDIAIPYMIGCGSANGNIDIVFRIINSIFDHSPINVNVYKI